MSAYDSETINSPNPLARYAHRNRLRKSVELALPRLRNGKVLDYGCGSGAFVSALEALASGCAVGYEPFMTDRCGGGLPIFSTLQDAEKLGPYNLITLFETIEHLSAVEIDGFLEVCGRNLSPTGGILISAPIEIGPALVLKELNRSILRFKQPEHRLVEFLKASLLGMPARRAEDIKISHRGFDFRQAMQYLQACGWEVEVLCYGPLPIGTWYGNSQVYLWASKRTPQAS